MREIEVNAFIDEVMLPYQEPRNELYNNIKTFLCSEIPMPPDSVGVGWIAFLRAMRLGVAEVLDYGRVRVDGIAPVVLSDETGSYKSYEVTGGYTLGVDIETLRDRVIQMTECYKARIIRLCELRNLARNRGQRAENLPGRHWLTGGRK